MTSINYSKWDNLANLQDQEEKILVEKQKYEARIKNYRENEDKKIKWEREHGKDNHQHQNQEEHNQENQISRPKCGCGFMSPEDMEKLKNAPPKEEISMEIKNDKKMKAILAAKEHGGIYFNEGNYSQALAGLLILNGVYDVSDADQEKLTELETVLNVNLAAVALKMKEYKKATDYGKAAKRNDKSNVKAAYRIAQGYLGMGEFDLATEECKAGLILAPSNIELKKLLEEIKRVDKEKSDKQRLHESKMAAAFQAAK